MVSITVPGAGVGGVQRETPLGVRETSWGYIIREDLDRFARETVVEAMGRFLGLVLVLSAYGQWLLPAALYSGNVLWAKAGVSFVLGLIGALVYWIASRGLHVEVQVDLTRRELRVVNRNSRNQTRVRRRVSMRNIESAFLRRATTRDVPAHLFLRLRGGQELHVATGSEKMLTAIHRRLGRDIRPASERLEDRLMRQVMFVSKRAG